MSPLLSWLLCFTVLTGAFWGPIYHWLTFSARSDLYSHTLLIPFISAYLIWLKRNQLTPVARGLLSIAILPILVGIGLLLFYFFYGVGEGKRAAQDYISLMMCAYLCFLAGSALFFLGHPFLKTILFPILFLWFMVPFPVGLENAIEQFFQRWSADATEGLVLLTGMNYLRVGQHFQFSGFSMTVAQECSGVHSSLVLFVTSLLAGYLFLRSPWRRTAFTAFVIPLGIVRNGFRITIIALLCVKIHPFYINSWLHRRGGPVFFVLSLVPFLLLLYLLKRTETKRWKMGFDNAGDSGGQGMPFGTNDPQNVKNVGALKR